MTNRAQKPRRKKPVLCIGSATIDNIYGMAKIPTEPTKVLAGQFRQISGGMAANAAAAIVRLGGQASFSGRIGDDFGGRFFLDDMEAAGVDVSRVQKLAGRQTTISSILIDDEGERLVCSFCDPEMENDLTWLDAEFVACFGAVLVDVRWPEAAEKCLRIAGQQKIPAVLDADIAEVSIINTLLPLASHPVFSETAFLQFTGSQTINDGLARISQDTDGFVGVTLGKDGVRWIADGAFGSVTAPEIHAVDTLGAGDVFHGAFALALCEGKDHDAAARFATVAASLKCTRFGGRLGTPTRSEVDGFCTPMRND